MWKFCVLFSLIVSLFAVRSIRSSSDADDSITILECCPSGQTMSSSRTCRSFNGVWSPVVVSVSNHKIVNAMPENFRFVQKQPTCWNSTFIRGSVFLNGDNGTLILSIADRWFSNDPSNCCISKSGVVCCMAEEELEPIRLVERRTIKCCPPNFVYSERTAKCVESVAAAGPKSTDELKTSGFPSCQSNELAVAGKLGVDMVFGADKLLYTENGSVVHDFCIDDVYEHLQEAAAMDTPSVFVCAETIRLKVAAAEKTDLRFRIYPAVLFLSNIFLVVTLISGCFLPVSYHALQWKCQTHYIVCLLIGNVLLMVTQLKGTAMKDTKLCVGIGIAMHFFFLAAFCWLTTMCCNIWWLFQTMRPATMNHRQEIHRFVFYGWFAWGLPLLIVGLGSMADHWLHHSYPTMPRPNFGKQSCWFENRTEQFFYFFAPLGFLLGVNFFFFGATTRQLACGFWKTETNKRSSHKLSLAKICFKLVVVMGVPWIMDILSWIFEGPDYIWYFTDLINASQGMLIFIAVGYPHLLWNALKSKFCCCCLGSVEQTQTDAVVYTSISGDRLIMRPEVTSC